MTEPVPTRAALPGPSGPDRPGAWLLDILRPRVADADRSIHADYSGRDGHAYAVSAVRGELASLRAAMPGSRNATAYRVACRLIELCLADWAHLDVTEVQDAYFVAAAAASGNGGAAEAFPYGEAWSCWLHAERKARTPAVLPVADFLGTTTDWAAPPSDFDHAGYGPALGSSSPFVDPGVNGHGGHALSNGAVSSVAVAVAMDPFETAVRTEMARIVVRETARARLSDAEFLRSWREPVSLGDLAAELATPEESPPWRVAGLLPAGGNAVVVAARKAGKTTMMGCLIRALVDGVAFLGRYPVTPLEGSVALFNYENTPRTQRDWLRGLGIAAASRVHVLHLRGSALSLAVPQVRAFVVDWLASRNVSVWIPDPYARVGQGVVDNENDNGQANRLTGLLDEIKAEAGVSEIVMPAHASSKTDVESGAETVRGAGRLEDWADALWYLSVVDQVRFLRATGRNVDLAETQLYFDVDSRSMSIGEPGRGRREVGLERDAARIMAALRDWTEASPATQNDLQTRCDLGSSRRVMAAVQWLIEQSMVWIEIGPNRTKYHHLGSKPN